MEDAPMHQGLLQAALSGDVATLVQLSDEGHLSGVAAGGNTAAHLASKLGHSEFLTEILRRCPSLLYRRNSTKDTALHCAARVGNDVCVRILLEEWRRSTAEGDLPDIADASGGAAASSIPAPRPDEAMEEDKERVAEASGGEKSVAKKNTEECNEVKKNMPQWRNKRGNTALHDAARKRHVQVVRTLLEADPQLASITNNAGASALLLAYDLSSPEMVEILVKYEPRTSHQLAGGDCGLPAQTISGCNATKDRPRRSSNTTAGASRKQEGRRRDEINQTTILINKLILTAVSVATFTFSAPIALPTGGDSNNGGGLGLEKKIALTTFLVSDAVAMVSSVVIVCLLVKMGFAEHGAALLESIHRSRKLVRVAIAALVVAFAGGTYFVFTFDDAWSAVTTCLIAGALPFVIYAVTWWPII